MSALLDLQQLTRCLHFVGLPKVAKDPVKPPVRIGVLGASQVATYALVWPAQRVPVAQVDAVAARSAVRAKEYAQTYKISKSYGSYDELLADPDIDAVYVGLPNGLHGQWARKALEAGKHVLCEKPLTANAEEARQVQEVAQQRGLLCREAFHYREHPLAKRLRELVLGPGQQVKPGGEGGVLGPLSSIDVELLIPRWVFPTGNIRYMDELAGGAGMDAGCYCVNIMRLLSGSPQPSVVSASADLMPGSKGLDGTMRAQLSWPSLPGLTARFTASLQHDGLFPQTRVTVKGAHGELTCDGFVMPVFGNRIHVRRRPGIPLPFPALGPLPELQASLASPAGASGTPPQAPHLVKMLPWSRVNEEEWEERVFGSGQETTYFHQLERFVEDLEVLRNPGAADKARLAAVKAAAAADAADCIDNMATLDAVYRAAGLSIRLPTEQFRSLYGSPTVAPAPTLMTGSPDLPPTGAGSA